MTEFYIQIFTTTATQLVPIIPYVFAIYLLLSMVANLLFKD